MTTSCSASGRSRCLPTIPTASSRSSSSAPRRASRSSTTIRRAPTDRRGPLAPGALLVLLVVAACGGRDAEPPRAALDTNLVVVTACGLRADLFEEACENGSAPALAQLRADAAGSATIATPAVDCLAAHASLFLGVAPNEHRIRGPASDVAAAAGASFIAAAKAAGARTAAFLSRPLVARGAAGGERDFGFALYDLPPIERFSLTSFGADAAALEPRRDDDATVAAALAWLAHAGTPFLLWIELDALALDTDAPAERLRAAALGRIAVLDRAVAALRRELARADRDRRTCFVLTADHGEALGEQGNFGHRAALDAVVRVPLVVVDPEARDRWKGAAPRDLTALGARLCARFHDAAPNAAPPIAPPVDRGNPFECDRPLALDDERGRLPLDDGAARKELPRLRADVAANPDLLPIAERYLAALHALESATADEKGELVAARAKWLERVAFGLPHRPLAAALLVRFGSEVGTTPERREAAALQAVRAAPWYFPAVRALASELARGQPARALAAMEEFGVTAPLTPAARDAFAKNLEVTRRNLKVAPSRPK